MLPRAATSDNDDRIWRKGQNSILHAHDSARSKDDLCAFRHLKRMHCDSQVEVD